MSDGRLSASTGIFDCSECGRRMMRLCGPDVGGPALGGLCAPCVVLPGWFREPNLRAVLAPTHDGREVVERLGAAPAWAP